MLLWLPYQLEARCDDLSQRPDPPDRPRKRRGAEAIAGDVLRPAVVTAVIDGFLEQLLQANVENRVDELRRELRKLDGKIANLTAIEQGRASLPSIIGLLSERQKERERWRPPMPASWNQIASWLTQIDNLRQAA